MCADFNSLQTFHDETCQIVPKAASLKKLPFLIKYPVDWTTEDEANVTCITVISESTKCAQKQGRMGYLSSNWHKKNPKVIAKILLQANAFLREVLLLIAASYLKGNRIFYYVCFALRNDCYSSHSGQKHFIYFTITS